jgi:hypothetical protein
MGVDVETRTGSSSAGMRPEPELGVIDDNDGVVVWRRDGLGGVIIEVEQDIAVSFRETWGRYSSGIALSLEKME